MNKKTVDEIKGMTLTMIKETARETVNEIKEMTLAMIGESEIRQIEKMPELVTTALVTQMKRTARDAAREVLGALLSEEVLTARIKEVIEDSITAAMKDIQGADFINVFNTVSGVVKDIAREALGEYIKVWDCPSCRGNGVVLIRMAARGTSRYRCVACLSIVTLPQ